MEPRPRPPSTAAGPVALAAVPAATVRALRASVLRPVPGDEAVFPGDDDRHALHLAAFADGQVVAVGSVLPEPCPDRPAAAWRIRGMATDPGWRRRGLGTQVLDGLLAYARAGGGGVWCWARVGAVTLYERAGLVAVGPVTDVDGHGPHRLMVDGARPPAPGRPPGA